MKTRLPSLIAAVILAAVCASSTAGAQQAPPWPARWLAAGVDFGSLKVEYRLTDDCQIDSEFEIAELPNLDVTRDEVLESLQRFLAGGTRDDIPPDVVVSVIEDEFGQEGIPSRPMTGDEYERVTAEFERLGPWPQIRIAPVGRSTYRCTFDLSGELVRLERSDAEKDLYTDFNERLSEQGPFSLQWVIEE